MLTDRLLAESNARVSEDGKSITYTVTASALCTDDDEDEDGSERSAEDIAEDLQDFEACAQRLNANPIVIEATSIGDRKINLAVAIGESSSDDLRFKFMTTSLPASSVCRSLNPFWASLLTQKT